MLKAAVIGHPVTHSLSPRLFEFWLKQYGIKGEYTAMDVSPQNLKDFLPTVITSELVGINVTVPHKESVLSLVEIDKAAKAIGAVNAITVKNGKLHGTNTDAFGFIENLRQNGFPKKKNQAVIIGAGGAARAVVHALAEEGFKKILITNRTASKAEIIAKHYSSVDVVDWNARVAVLEGSDLLVNTTTLGMKNQPPLELDLSRLPTTAVVNDIVYAPLETALLKAAKTHGNKTVDGLGMLLYQAVPAFELWFGKRPAVTDVLRKAVLA